MPVCRRTFAGMLGAVDEAVGNLTSALRAKGMLDNTVLLVTTDNGAPYTHFNEAAMSNFPLRGGKGIYMSNFPLRGGKGIYMYVMYVYIYAGRVCSSTLFQICIFSEFSTLFQVELLAI